MIKSMTGYGSAKGTVEGLEISVELKSVNNRYLDASVRMPRSFLFAEDAVKSLVQQHISRGKVDVFVSVDSSMADDMTVRVNEPLLRGYLEAINHIAEEYKLPNDGTAMSITRFPDVLSVEKKEADADAISAGICAIAEKALCDFDAMRLREGEKLRDDVLSKEPSEDSPVLGKYGAQAVSKVILGSLYGTAFQVLLAGKDQKELDEIFSLGNTLIEICSK